MKTDKTKRLRTILIDDEENCLDWWADRELRWMNFCRSPPRIGCNKSSDFPTNKRIQAARSCLDRHNLLDLDDRFKDGRKQD